VQKQLTTPLETKALVSTMKQPRHNRGGCGESEVQFAGCAWALGRCDVQESTRWMATIWGRGSKTGTRHMALLKSSYGLVSFKRWRCCLVHRRSVAGHQTLDPRDAPSMSAAVEAWGCNCRAMHIVCMYSNREVVTRHNRWLSKCLFSVIFAPY
jgi:hypothetical protein